MRQVPEGIDEINVRFGELCYSGFNHGRRNWPSGFDRHDDAGEFATVDNRQLFPVNEFPPQLLIHDIDRSAGRKPAQSLGMFRAPTPLDSSSAQKRTNRLFRHH